LSSLLGQPAAAGDRMGLTTLRSAESSAPAGKQEASACGERTQLLEKGQRRPGPRVVGQQWRGHDQQRARRRRPTVTRSTTLQPSRQLRGADATPPHAQRTHRNVSQPPFARPTARRECPGTRPCRATSRARAAPGDRSGARSVSPRAARYHPALTGAPRMAAAQCPEHADRRSPVRDGGSRSRSHTAAGRAAHPCTRRTPSSPPQTAPPECG
jgi:hypothetical protein